MVNFFLKKSQIKRQINKQSKNNHMKKQVYRFTYFPLTCALKRFAKQKKKLNKVILSFDCAF